MLVVNMMMVLSTSLSSGLRWAFLTSSFAVILPLTFVIFFKFHYQDEIRGMTLSPETPFAEFMDKVAAKFQKDINGLTLKFKDEDDGKVTLRDDSDYELMIETARESSKGKLEGKLAIWCTDV